jgi:hypothetical protein
VVRTGAKPLGSASSAARSRAHITLSNAFVTAGSSSSSGRNDHDDSEMVRSGASARTVADRGCPSISEISPKYSPGPRVRIEAPRTDTDALPCVIRWKPVAPPPSSVISLPGSWSTTLAWSAIDFRDFLSSDEKRSVRPSASTMPGSAAMGSLQGVFTRPTRVGVRPIITMPAVRHQSR